MAEQTRIHRPRQQSATAAARERAKRNRIQRERPTLEELAASGEYSEPMSQGEFWDIRRTMEKLKLLRVSSGLSLADMTAQTGIDRAALSRLENGVAVNPTINTLYRYTAAMGKKIVVTIVDEGEADKPKSTGKVVRLKVSGKNGKGARVISTGKGGRAASKDATVPTFPTTPKRNRKAD